MKTTVQAFGDTSIAPASLVLTSTAPAMTSPVRLPRNAAHLDRLCHRTANVAVLAAGLGVCLLAGVPITARAQSTVPTSVSVGSFVTELSESSAKAPAGVPLLNKMKPRDMVRLPQTDAVFGNIAFKQPDTKAWTHYVDQGRLIFSPNGMTPASCSLTIEPPIKLKNSLQIGFLENMASELLRMHTGKILYHSEMQTVKTPLGYPEEQMLVRAETPEGTAICLFTAMDSHGLMDMAIVRGTDAEALKANRTTIETFTESLTSVSEKILAKLLPASEREKESEAKTPPPAATTASDPSSAPAATPVASPPAGHEPAGAK